MIFSQKIGRFFWLIKSADLNFFELANIVVNRFIYLASRGYYFCKAFVFGQDPKVFYNYRRHLPQGIKFKGYCLLAYLVEPIAKEYFVGNVKYYFSNNGAPLCVLQALNELGYAVDVINYNHKSFLPARDYSLFFFHQHEIFEALRPKLGKSTTCIMFETTAYFKPMVEKIQKRLLDFKDRHKISLSETEYNHFFWMQAGQAEIENVSKKADGVVVMGDQLAGSFKLLENPNVKLVKSAVYPDFGFQKDLSLEKLAIGKKNFLFFGGGTDVMRKGVDILLEAFIGSPYELFLCISLPPLFEDIYKVNQQKNIHNLGYLKVGSKKFYEIINLCDFVIQPSCAEGVPGGVLETMKYGLMPIVSQECNIPEASEVGYLLPEVTVESVKDVLRNATSLTSNQLLKKAEATVAVMKELYNPEVFIRDLKKVVVEVVKNN